MKTDLSDTYASPETLTGAAAIAAQRARLDERGVLLDGLGEDYPEVSMQARLAQSRARDALDARQVGLRKGVSARNTELQAAGVPGACRARVTMSARMTKSIQELTLSEKRLVSLAGTKLYGTVDVSPLVVITAADYSTAFGTSMQQAYQELQAACGWDPVAKTFSHLSGLPSKRITFSEETGEGTSRRPDRKATSIGWVQLATYNTGSGEVELRFANDLVPHLRNISERFGQYLLENTKGLRNMAAWRLVDICSPHHLGRFAISTVALMDALEVTARQRDFKVFSREVLTPAVKALNIRFSDEGADPLDRTKNLQLTPKKVRGRSAAVTHVEFSFNPNRLLRPALPLRGPR